MTLKPYPNYKDSGVEWLGQVPEHWEVTKIKYLAELTPKKLSVQRDLYCSFIPMEKLKTDSIILDNNRLVGDVCDGYTYFEENDILVAKVTPCFENKNIAIAKNLTNGIGFGSSEIYVVRVKEKLSNNRFLFYRLQENSFMNIAISSMTGTGGLKRVPSEILTDFVLAFPSFQEQTTIATYLDQETARLDELITHKTRFIELLKEKRSALITHAVTKGLNPNVPMKDSGVEWLGQVPEHWDVKRLKFVAHLKSGETITANEIEEKGNYPVYGGNGLRGFSSTFTHNGCHVLIGRQGALCGNINYADGYFFASEHAVVVTSICNIFWLGELFRIMNLGQYSVSTAQPGISVEVINELSIPVPSIQEQTAIATYLDQETARIDELVQLTKQSIKLIKERRSALITAAVTGKIDVREQTQQKDAA